MPIYYSAVCDAGALVNESGDRDSVSRWGKVARALIERIEPRTRKSYEHEGYVFFWHSVLNPKSQPKPETCSFYILRRLFNGPDLCLSFFLPSNPLSPTSNHPNTISHSINYIAETDRVYLAVADKAMNTRIVFAFLEKIRGRYAGENGSSFNAVLGEQMVQNPFLYSLSSGPPPLLFYPTEHKRLFMVCASSSHPLSSILSETHTNTLESSPLGFPSLPSPFIFHFHLVFGSYHQAYII